MKSKSLLLFVFLVFGLVLHAQNISVKSFKALPMDMSASSKEGKRIDQNGQVAALIKVVTNETGFVFEGGTLGIVDSQQRVSEIWVWVPRASRKITILHPKLGQLRDYIFPIEIEAERTYEMVLVTATIETVVKPSVTQQYLVFKVKPQDAALEVNDEIWPVSSQGVASKYVNFGTYTYRVQAPNYHSDAGRVTVDDPDNKKIVEINLNPNFGWIEVSGGSMLSGANVYIDNAFVGKAPYKSEALKSGQHSVKIAKELYDTYSEMVTVNDNQTTTVSPSLSANFSHLTFSVEADAEIWINEERKGTGTWSGDLASGSYRIECRKANHETSVKTLEVTNQMNGDLIKLDAPRPIYGSLNLESTPELAEIFIDGQPMGETPNVISEILIGQHNLRLAKEGYLDHSETVTVRKDERTLVQVTMNEKPKPVVNNTVYNNIANNNVSSNKVINSKLNFINEKCKGSKYGCDSVTGVTNLSVYREYYKQWESNRYAADAVRKEMISCWRYVFLNCPRSSQLIYTNGEKFMDYFIRQNPQQKDAYIDTICMLMDTRAHYFPNDPKTGRSQVASIIGRKGLLIYTYNKNRYEEAYNVLREAFALDASQMQGAYMDAYFKATIDMVNNNKAEKMAIINVYQELSEALDDNIKALAENAGDFEKNKKSININKGVKKNLDNLFQPYASCENLNKVFSAKMAETPNDVMLLKRIITVLDKKDCTDSKVFLDAVVKLNGLESSPEASYGMGVKYFMEKKYSDAAASFEQAAKTENNDRKYRAYRNLAFCHQFMGNYSKARDNARRAAQVDPMAGEPYLIIAQLYAESAKQFSGEVDRNAVYWVAVDKCQQAKTIDASCVERADALIRVYSASFPTMETIFFNDYSEGQKYNVGGWIGETTTIRARK